MLDSSAIFDQYDPYVAGDLTPIGSGITSFAIAGNGDVIMFDANLNADNNYGTVSDQWNARLWRCHRAANQRCLVPYRWRRRRGHVRRQRRGQHAVAGTMERACTATSQ